MRPILVLFPLLLLAGCASPGAPLAPAATTAAPAAPDDAPVAVAFEANETVTGSWYAVTYPDDARTIWGIPIARGATRLVVEVAWTGPGDLDAFAAAPAFCEEGQRGDAAATLLCIKRQMEGTSGDGWHVNAKGTPAQPDSPSRVEVPAEELAAGHCKVEVCRWSIGAVVKAAAETKLTLVATIEYPPGVAVPAEARDV